MESGFFILIFIGFAALVIVLAIHAHKKEKERRQKLAAWAQGLGLHYSADKRRDFDDEYPQLDFLRKGSGRYAYNLVGGRLDDNMVTFFDYHYETHSTDSKGNRTTQHHHFSGVLVAPQFPLRGILIRREGMFDRMKAAFGWNDIDFESAEFSRKFFVKCEDRRWAYDAIHGETMERLLNTDTKWALESDGRVLAVYSSKRFEIPECERAHALATGMLDGIPAHARDSAIGNPG